MAAKILLDEIDGTPKQICLRVPSTFSPDSTKDLRIATPTEVNLDLVSLAASAYRQSAKFDFGAVRAPLYDVWGVLEFAASVAAGKAIEFYMGYSPSSTAANANPANLSGSDAAYTGYASNADDAVKQLQYVGAMITTANATTTLQVGYFGAFAPQGGRYGIAVVRSRLAVAFHSSSAKMHIVLNPTYHESQ